MQSTERIRELISDGDLASIGQALNGHTLRDQVTIAEVDAQAPEPVLFSPM